MLVLPGVHALAAGPDRMGQKNSQKTQLGKRLAPLAGRHDMPPYNTAYWRKARTIIETSDAAKDARADTAAGHIGFMTHANDAIAESPIAPGFKCFDRSEASRRTVFLYSYQGPLTHEAGGALLAFDAYARLYNGHIFKNGALGETSCISSGW